VAEWEIRPMAAQAMEMPASVSHHEGIAIGSTERPAVTPSIAAPALAPMLQEAFAPHLFQADSLSPQEHATLPAPAGEMPLASMPGVSDPQLERSLATGLDSFAGVVSGVRPSRADVMFPDMPAFVPPAAAPRYEGEFHAAGPSLATAIPDGTSIGFTASPFGKVGPEPIVRPLQRLSPEATPLAQSRISLREPVAPIASMGLPERMGVVALDVYVQRVRSTPKRECAPKVLDVRVTQPTVMPGIWPARFEQLVLQDWKRRYPARQVSMTPAPIGGARILPIARHLPALARLRQNAPHFVKGVAAAAVVCSILWFSWSAKAVRSTVTADRHWLRDTISKRATLVHDDNFHSGLNLWEGRKNWASSWAYSRDGFMRTGQLALYRPTLKMDNYRLEFFTQIESKSVGWVVRAKDEQNYYAMKLSVTEPGPRPLVSVVRYPVLNGHKGKRVQIPLPIMMHNNTPYHVAVDVKGTRFRAFVEDQEVDSWNDDRLRAGGVGFFSETGEHARLYWVKVSKNTDWLGKLCGFIAGASAAQDSADMWNPADPNGSMAALDPGSILDGAKNVDMKRGVRTLPLAVFFGSSL
jgi:hypothetical protein